MTMKPLIIALAATLTVTSSLTMAQTYQWKDGNGRTVISDTPPPGAARQPRSIESSRSPESQQPTEAQKSMADKEMDFKQRQQEAREKADKERKESAANAEKNENCQRARQQLVALESGQRISSTDVNGERRYMEDAERQRETERTRKFLAETCK